MKYIMFQTDTGQKLPVMFPDVLTHSIVSMVLTAGIEVCLNSKAVPVSAGFVSTGWEVTVDGESESLGLKSVPSDAARIVVGGSIEFMPDKAAELMLTMLQERQGAGK